MYSISRFPLRSDDLLWPNRQGERPVVVMLQLRGGVFEQRGGRYETASHTLHESGCHAVHLMTNHFEETGDRRQIEVCGQCIKASLSVRAGLGSFVERQHDVMSVSRVNAPSSDWEPKLILRAITRGRSSRSARLSRWNTRVEDHRTCVCFFAETS